MARDPGSVWAPLPEAGAPDGYVTCAQAKRNATLETLALVSPSSSATA